jgi:hypothetical protein
MTQVVKKPCEGNGCKDAGFPSQMIGFQKSDKREPDGKAGLPAKVHRLFV